MKRKIILDTDIGDDIDDAFALAFALSLAKVEIVGITTVFRNTKERAQLARKLLDTAGLNIPVYAGEPIPEREPIHFFEKDGDGAPETQHICQWDETYGNLPVRSGAVEFLAEQAELLGEELTVVAIGPMTNLARAIKSYPKAMKRLGAVISMGGSFEEYCSEWNILCDPEAADVVYGSGIPVYAVGLDVTLKCPLESDLLDSFRASEKPVNKLLSLWLDRWFAFFGFEKSVMHDPLTVACLISDVCTFEKRYVRVELEDMRGAVHTSEDAREGYVPVFVATKVCNEMFYSLIRKAML